jgi:hypothetical protein
MWPATQADVSTAAAAVAAAVAAAGGTGEAPAAAPQQQQQYNIPVTHMIRCLLPYSTQLTLLWCLVRGCLLLT